MSNDSRSCDRSRRNVLSGIGAVAILNLSSARPVFAAEAWQKVKAFGVEFEVPASWKRREYHRPRDDHEEVQFAQNAKDIAAGSWFSIFPTNDDLIDPDRKEQPATVDGRAAKMTDMTSINDPPPRRRQIVVYFRDPRAPAFLFDANSEQWTTWGPVLDHILASVRLPKH